MDMADKKTELNLTADALRGRFADLRDTDTSDPLANPVRRFASEIFLALENGAIAPAALSEVIATLEVEGFEARAQRFLERRDPKSCDLDDPLKSLEGLDFEAFRARVEQTGVGVVFTAHPTFALGAEKRALLARYPLGGESRDLEDWLKEARAVNPLDPKKITLWYEHGEARLAIENAQNAIRVLNRRILERAKAQFPKDWRSLTPDPVSLASWVGYDLDGRTDIHWGQSIRIRLEEKAAQLRRYAAAIEKVLKTGVEPRLETLFETISGAAEAARWQAEAFAGDLNDPDLVVRAANLLTRESEGRLVSLKPVIAELSAIIESDKDEARALELCLIRAEMKALGLGVARIHLRVNAAQVRSALKTDLGLDPDSDFAGRSALEVASRKAKSAAKRSINFGSVFLEKMTARRQFMLCAQILKHIDADTPIRFLIAECEAPATVMGAVYLARLYGVDHKLDISPLFETPQAMERGGRFIERLLDEPEYCDYVRTRNRMAIQIGFSDSGRFIGQCSASLAIERLQVLFAKALGKAGLKNVEALIFNTHGESMGRGAHPGNFRLRLNHLATPWVKARFRKENVFLNCECSFQGGEGYLHFQTPAFSEATISMLWEQEGEAPPPDLTDRFYEDINFSWDFYRGLKAWQEALYEREDYRRLLFAFPQRLLYKTGSRESKRPRQGSGAPEIRSMRAIPHNAILQQMAIPVNVSGGIGAASGREIDRMVEHVRASPRMREIMEMAFKARSLTSIAILRSYAGVYSPAYWSALAGTARKTDKADIYEHVLQALLRDDTAASIDRTADYLARDLRTMDAVRDLLGESEGKPSGPDPGLAVLHGLRQALIARAVSLTASAPDFSSRHDVDKLELIEMALELRLGEAAGLLKTIFPEESPAESVLAGLNEAVEGGEPHGGAYPEIHAAIIGPLEEIDGALGAISHAIANYYGAFG